MFSVPQRHVKGWLWLSDPFVKTPSSPHSHLMSLLVATLAQWLQASGSERAVIRTRSLWLAGSGGE